ncbi:hypothetical protein GCM10011409_20110 [Lentibacillus populi]|uniref:Uncharacterized protein n=1 Tax=Lentibacillus populi TaxID=1827502 RepID=A0A9W5TX97_9BACI|nr:hypothetical protein [Lentibacillus populi]GGB42507.1 hypothetical protein GCM10011409_20110 [Lentibacillus populi]
MDKLQLNPVALYDALLRLGAKDFDQLASYLEYLKENFLIDDVDLNFYQHKGNPGLVCICKVGNTIFGIIQLVADREG